MSLFISSDKVRFTRLKPTSRSCADRTELCVSPRRPRRLGLQITAELEQQRCELLPSLSIIMIRYRRNILVFDPERDQKSSVQLWTVCVEAPAFTRTNLSILYHRKSHEYWFYVYTIHFPSHRVSVSAPSEAIKQNYIAQFYAVSWVTQKVYPACKKYVIQIPCKVISKS